MKGQSYHDDFKGSGGCTEVFVNGIKGPRQIPAVKPGKANWRSVPAVKTPAPPQELPPVGLHCLFFSCPRVATTLCTGSLLVCLSGNWAVKLQMENAGSPQVDLMGGSSTSTPLQCCLFLVSVLFFLLIFPPSLILFIWFLLCCFLQGDIPTVASKSLFGN